MSKTQQSTGYQYKADGHLFTTQEEKQRYLETKAEQRDQARDEQYRDQQDRVPNWAWIEEYEC